MSNYSSWCSFIENLNKFYGEGGGENTKSNDKNVLNNKNNENNKDGSDNKKGLDDKNNTKNSKFNELLDIMLLYCKDKCKSDEKENLSNNLLKLYNDICDIQLSINNNFNDNEEIKYNIYYLTKYFFKYDSSDDNCIFSDDKLFLYKNFILNNETNVVLTDDIYLQHKNNFKNLFFAFAQKCLSNLVINSCNNLNNLNLSNIDCVKNDFILFNLKLDEIKCEKLVNVKNLNFTDLFINNDINLNQLKHVSTFYFDNVNFSKLNELNLDDLNCVDNIIIKKCTNLKKISINSLKQTLKIVIDDCPNLEQINFTSLRKINKKLKICRCNNLSSINIPLLSCIDTLNISKCNSTNTKLNINLDKLKSVIKMLYLNDLNINDLDLNNLDYIKYLYLNCKQLNNCKLNSNLYICKMSYVYSYNNDLCKQLNTLPNNSYDNILCTCINHNHE